MIPIEKLKQVTVIYCHDKCPDGLASAMILQDAFRMLGMEPKIEFLVHGTDEHRLAGWGDGMFALFCDIAPHPEAVEGRMVGQFSGPPLEMPGIVLDHHKGVEALVRSFGERGVFADEKLDPGVSGAVLAWREVWAPVNRETGTHDFLMGAMPINVEEFAKCVGARDTWQTQDPRFQRGQWISKALMSKPASWWLGDHSPYLYEGELLQGRALFEAHEEVVRQAVEQCVPVTVNGVRLIVFQEQACGFRLTSDVAEALRGKNLGAFDEAVVAGFSFVVNKPGDKPVLTYSLRGIGGFDVAAFAKANGGGGHTAAAGFSIGFPEASRDVNPYDYIKDRLEEHVGRRTP